MNKWYIENGDQGDIVISTRVRLARNLEEYPFPCRLTVKGKEKVCEEIKNAVLSDDHWGFGFTWMKDFTRSQAVSLAERHLVSPEFVSDRAGRGLLLTDDEAISIMLCEEDHIRLQVMMAGLALKEAYSVADKKLKFSITARKVLIGEGEEKVELPGFTPAMFSFDLKKTK